MFTESGAAKAVGFFILFSWSEYVVLVFTLSCLQAQTGSLTSTQTLTSA